MAGIKFKFTPGPVNPPIAFPDYHVCEIYKDAVRTPSLDSPHLAAETEYVIDDPAPGTYTGIWYAYTSGVKSNASAPKSIIVPQPGSNSVPTPIAQEPEYVE